MLFLVLLVGCVGMLRATIVVLCSGLRSDVLYTCWGLDSPMFVPWCSVHWFVLSAGFGCGFFCSIYAIFGSGGLLGSLVWVLFESGEVLSFVVVCRGFSSPFWGLLWWSRYFFRLVCLFCC